MMSANGGPRVTPTSPLPRVAMGVPSPVPLMGGSFPPPLARAEGAACASPRDLGGLWPFPAWAGAEGPARLWLPGPCSPNLHFGGAVWPSFPSLHPLCSSPRSPWQTPSVPPSIGHGGRDALQHPALSSHAHPGLPGAGGFGPGRAADSSSSQRSPGRGGKARRPGSQMKPQLPPRDAVPMATAPSAGRSILSSSSPLRICAGIWGRSLLGRAEGAGGG